MLEKFGVLVLSEYLNEKEEKLIIRSFSDFYHDQTPKHQKRLKLNWVEGINSTSTNLDQLFHAYGLTSKIVNKISFVDRAQAMKNSSVMLYPSSKHMKVVIPDAFSFGLPVISVEHGNTDEFIDMSCGMIIEFTSIEQLASDITGRLDMLYHDQEVLKLLERGAFDQYERKFGWGLKEFRKPLF